MLGLWLQSYGKGACKLQGILSFGWHKQASLLQKAALWSVHHFGFGLFNGHVGDDTMKWTARGPLQDTGDEPYCGMALSDWQMSRGHSASKRLDGTSFHQSAWNGAYERTQPLNFGSVLFAWEQYFTCFGGSVWAWPPTLQWSTFSGVYGWT